jgi:predicted nucleic acid-binding protein
MNPGQTWKDAMTARITVIDASLVIKAILPNEENTACQAALAELTAARLAAPALWVYEITSTFAKAVHFGQITQEEGSAAIHQALALGVEIIPPDETQSLLAFQWTLKLKRAAAYDSFYLAIAEALEADFWTADRRLFRSLEAEKPGWLHWVGEMMA